MPLIALALPVVAVVFSYGSTVAFIVAIVNAVLAFFAINTVLNLGTQLETGDTTTSWGTYKSASVGALTVNWIAAIVLIVIAVA